MAFMNDEIFDQGLDWAAANGTRLDICSADPGGTYSNVTANTLGNKSPYVVAAPAAGSPDGRAAVGAAVTDGVCTGTGLATHWAITNGTDTVVASGALSTSQNVTDTNPFTLDAINLTHRDATAA